MFETSLKNIGKKNNENIYVIKTESNNDQPTRTKATDRTETSGGRGLGKGVRSRQAPDMANLIHPGSPLPGRE